MDSSPSVLILLILLSAFFSGLEIAFFTLSDSKITALVEKNVRGAKRVQQLKSHPDKLLITILVGNNIVNIAASAIATVFATQLFGNSGAGIAVGVMTIVILIFGEITPKSIATRYGETIALWFSPIVQFLMYILSPIIWVFIGINHLITHSFEKATTISEEEEIHALTRIGVKEGTIEKHEERFIQNILEFDDITVEQIMKPRVEIIALDGNKTLGEVFPIIQKARFSRYPVYENNIDNIVGILYIKDLFLEKKEMQQMKVNTLTKPPLFVSNSSYIDAVFREMKTKRIHIAIVHDEHGGTDGMITLEDIIEELVGEIDDEKDKKEILITHKGPNTWIANGKIELKELVDHINVDFEDEHMTLRAFLNEMFEHTPHIGEVYDTEKYTMEIVAASANKVELVKIKKKD